VAPPDRHEHVHQRVSAQDATDGVLVHADANERQSPERALLDRSVSDDVQRALEALPDDFRTAVVLCDVQGLSYKEIADIMQTPVGTVMSRLFRGRKLLAAALRDFALAEGYVRDGATTTDPKPESKTIDLEKYRAAKARGESA
jgi:RNA polymerase sigma-70 factor, ECF subfamily